jgi:hypothetical protein
LSGWTGTDSAAAAAPLAWLPGRPQTPQAPEPDPSPRFIRGPARAGQSGPLNKSGAGAFLPRFFPPAPRHKTSRQPLPLLQSAHRTHRHHQADVLRQRNINHPRPDNRLRGGARIGDDHDVETSDPFGGGLDIWGNPCAGGACAGPQPDPE